MDHHSKGCFCPHRTGTHPFRNLHQQAISRDSFHSWRTGIAWGVARNFLGTTRATTVTCPMFPQYEVSQCSSPSFGIERSWLSKLSMQMSCGKLLMLQWSHRCRVTMGTDGYDTNTCMSQEASKWSVISYQLIITCK